MSGFNFEYSFQDNRNQEHNGEVWEHNLAIDPRQTLLTPSPFSSPQMPHNYSPPPLYPLEPSPFCVQGSSHPDIPPLMPELSPQIPPPQIPPTRQCSHCGTTTTPVWRRDPATSLPLCNACGVYLSQRSKHRPQRLVELGQAEQQQSGSPEDAALPEDARQCFHCGTRRTSTWRKNSEGMRLCNACGVYERLHGRERPLELRSDRVRPRGGR